MCWSTETIPTLFHICTAARQRSAPLPAGGGGGPSVASEQTVTSSAGQSRIKTLDPMEMVSPGSRYCPLEVTPESAHPYLNTEGR